MTADEDGAAQRWNKQRPAESSSDLTIDENIINNFHPAMKR
jgi:hypothetical protein